MANLRAQAERFGAELVPDDVTEVDLTGDVKRVWTGDEQYGGRTDAGDVVDDTCRQAVTAAGTRCAAALDAEGYLDLLADQAASPR